MRQARPFQMRRAGVLGFSLVEVVMVLAIVAILALIAAPRYARALTQYRAEAAARRIVGDLELARAAARSSSSSRQVAFNTSTDRYELVGVTATQAAGSGAYVVRLAEEPYGVDLLTASFGGSATLEFNGYGLPVAGGSITLRVGDRVRTITVSAAGQVTVQ